MATVILFAEYPLHGVTVRSPEEGDLEYLVANLRQADVQEVEAYGGTVAESLAEGLAPGRSTYVVTLDDEPVVVFGVGPDPSQMDVGVIWLLGTDKMRSISRLFIRESKTWLKDLGEPYDLLHNLTDARNKLHHRWLKWCGFTFGPLKKIGPQKLPFYPIYKRTDLV